MAFTIPSFSWFTWAFIAVLVIYLFGILVMACMGNSFRMAALWPLVVLFGLFGNVQ